MNLSQIPQQQPVIIDTNIFVYATQKSSNQCIKLLEKCANEELLGIVPTHTLAELTHLLMLAEASDLGLLKESDHYSKQLSDNPNKLKVLNRYESLIRDILSIGLKLESLQREDFFTAMSLQHQYGLLMNDALFLAVATRLRVTAVVSANPVFKNVREIFLYSPDDLINE